MFRRTFLFSAAVIAAPLVFPAAAFAAPAREDIPVLGPKPFIAYFKTTPLVGKLRTDVWGAKTVGPRDIENGLEDPAMAQWNYWDGQILRGADGKYRLFGSRWAQADGHYAWGSSHAIIATSDNLYGPYKDQGKMWPTDQDGRGHNVIALQLHDGRYAVVVSETREGGVFVSDAIDGPWTYLGPIQVDQSEFASLFTPGDTMPAPGTPPKPWRASNVGVIARPGGGYLIIQRSGQVLLSEGDILGPYKVTGDSIFRGVKGIPQDTLDRMEDPVMWFSGGWYHVLANHWENRVAYHLISRDGIKNWKLQGLAYEPNADFIRYETGVKNHWNKLERPAVVMEDGHVIALTFAVIDVSKDDQKGNDGHGSKIIVVPFDGKAMDKDLAKIAD